MGFDHRQNVPENRIVNANLVNNKTSAFFIVPDKSNEQSGPVGRRIERADLTERRVFVVCEFSMGDGACL